MGLSAYQHGHQCTECKQEDFEGTLYKCRICSDVKYCENCRSHHGRDHALSRVPCQLDLACQLSHENVTCNGCHTRNFQGPRHSCKVCPNFHLCEVCFANDNFFVHGPQHNKSHPMGRYRPKETLHAGIECSECGEEEILGRRYKCGVCVDYNICQKCREDSQRTHDATHKLLRVKTGNIMKVHANITCDGCGTQHFEGNRYRCKICLNYDLCDSCKHSHRHGPVKNHQKEHEMIEALPKGNSMSKELCSARALRMQQLFACGMENMGFDQYDPEGQEGIDSLAQKIGYVMCGEPKTNPSEDSSCKFGYTSEEEGLIVRICERVKNNANGEIIEITFILVCMFVDNREDSFVLMKQKVRGKVIYLEENGRTYNGWEDFIGHNQLPDCYLVVPADGEYTLDSTRMVMIFEKYQEESKVLKVTDTLATVGGSLATVVVIASFFTTLGLITAIAIGAVVGAYSGVKSAANLVDRYQHGQSINPFTSKAVFCDWMSLIGSTVGLFVSAGNMYMSHMINNYQCVGHARRAVLAVAILAGTGISGAGLLVDIYSMVSNVGVVLNVRNN